MSSTQLIKPTKGSELQKVLQSRGDVGVPKVTKKSPTKPQGFNLSVPRKRKESPNLDVETLKFTKVSTIQTPKLPKYNKPLVDSKNQENSKSKLTPMPFKKLEPKSLSEKKPSVLSEKHPNTPAPQKKNPLPKIPVFREKKQKEKPKVKVPVAPNSPIVSVSTLKQKLKESEEKIVEQSKEIEDLKKKNGDLQFELEKY